MTCAGSLFGCLSRLWIGLACVVGFYLLVALGFLIRRQCLRYCQKEPREDLAALVDMAAPEDSEASDEV